MGCPTRAWQLQLSLLSRVMIARPLEKVGLGRSNWDPSRDRGIV